MDKQKKEDRSIKLGSILLRILTSMLVLAIAAFFTPNFSITGIFPLLIAAVIIGVIDYLVERFTGFDASPFGRGITGFIVSAIIIYFTGYIVQGVTVSILGAIFAALAIGIINMIIPGKAIF